METNNYAALAGIVDMLLDAICVVDPQGRYVYVSAACERVFGYTQQELIGTQMLDLVHPLDRERTLAAAREVMDGQPKLHFENRYIRKDGRVVHIMWSARWSADNQMRIAVARDVTERKRSELLRTALFEISEAAHSAENLPGLFRRLHPIIGTLLPAQNFSVVLFDPLLEQLSFAWHGDEKDAGRESPVAEALAWEIVKTGKAVICATNSERLPEHLRHWLGEAQPSWLGVPLDAQGQTIGAMLVMAPAQGAHYSASDEELLQFVAVQAAAAIYRQQMHERLKHMAQFDQLTGLPNRLLLQDRLLIALEQARISNGRLAVLYLDLDKFKQVNDTFGHAAGDQLLQEVAQRLSRCVREADTVARIGGDEFIVLLNRIMRDEDAATVAKKILLALNEPMYLGDVDWPIKPSIGIAYYPEDATDLGQLFRRADESMYEAKKQGGNRYSP
ncbi:GGDEF domain-containing protein [Pseudomonas syringae]|uniref:Diguanylate cyclase n=1 Tax=Pseudomonas syringae TaxID=317 RepID=A0A085V418_PSESX|nr:GGDEF domain-containing protein [Pseudomonas syringae]KFE50181.1 diguanylate cyclase [Pseudomonas syringae]